MRRVGLGGGTGVTKELLVSASRAAFGPVEDEIRRVGPPYDCYSKARAGWEARHVARRSRPHCGDSKEGYDLSSNKRSP